MSTMLEEQGAKIKTIGASVTGITEAFDPPPASLNTASLPGLYAFTGAASYDRSTLGPRFARVRRTWRIQVAVIPTGQGDPATREALCRPLIDAVKNEFMSHPKLGKLARVEEAIVTGDSGVVILPEWGGKYIGFEVRMDVITNEPRTYAQGE